MKWAFVAMDELDDEQDTGLQKLKWLLALLRAQYWSYQNSHWKVKGDSFYGDHLMFQRLYESVQVQTDTLAEKMVGIFGIASIDSEDLLGMFLYWNERWDSVDCLHKRGLLSETDIQNVIKDTYDHLTEDGQMSLGMDDFLMAMASEHETNTYLLRQILRGRTAMQTWTPVTKKD
jgi:DNA-binding ferritin-like protein